MAVAILAGLFVLLVFGLAVAVSTAVHARRELEDRDEQIAEGGHSPLYRGSEPAPWSSLDLDGLRDDVTEVNGHDPFATLVWEDSPVSWHGASGSKGSETTPTTNTVSDADLEPAGNLRPVSSLRPLGSQAAADAPVIVFVVGAGFLGTGVTAGVTTAARLRRAWVEINDSFAQSGVITFDPDAEPAARPSDDRGAARDPVIVDDEPVWPRVRRRNGDPFSTREEDDSWTSSPSRSNGLGLKPTADPEPIRWRAPAEAARRPARVAQERAGVAASNRSARPTGLTPPMNASTLAAPSQPHVPRDHRRDGFAPSNASADPHRARTARRRRARPRSPVF